MIVWASSSAPAACLRICCACWAMESAWVRTASSLDCVMVHSLSDSACSALAFNANSDSEWARVSCDSAAMASASCWLFRLACRVCA